jgi:hypothetical protein
MPDIALPVFADEHGDLSVFDSVDAMDRQIEAIDVENDEYEFFDAEGRRLAAHVDTRSGRVTFRIDDEQPADPARLAARLRSYFQRLPPHLEAFRARAEAASSLESLVALRQELERQPKSRLLGRWRRGLRRD